MQPTPYLLPPDASIQTLVISRRRQFDKLFDGYTDLRAISYVTSAELLLEFLDQRGFERIELLVGDDITAKQLKDDLGRKAPAVTERLAQELEKGRLRILLPQRTVHTKLYILGGPQHTRVVVTSANLTHTARRAATQMNYAWYVDVPHGHPILGQVQEDYQAQCKNATLFMGDLLDLFNRRGDVAREDVVSVWLGGEGDTLGQHAEVRAYFQELTSQVFAHPGQEDRPLIHLDLPTAPFAQKRVRQLLRPLGIDEKAPESSVTPLQIARYVEEVHGVPLMQVDVFKGALSLGFRGDIRRIDAPPASATEVFQALAHVEDYVNTVDLGQCPDPMFAKTSMYEALLYLMASPFANEQMKERRRRLGGTGIRRGPQFLYIYGPAQNGKSTFLRYFLKLLTGSLVDPLPGDWCKKSRILGVQAMGTCFPLLFDDLTSTTSKSFENIAKAHWETAWTDGSVFPQMVFTSNTLNLKDWAKSRIKRIDFDVQFVSTIRTQEHLARIMEQPNPIFGWFAHGFLARMQDSSWLQDDELGTAREVVKHLYAYAERSLPNYFPAQPLEKLYDPDLRVWKELMRRNKVTVHKEREQTVAQFSNDLERTEIGAYLMALPQIVKYRQTGKTLIIQNPAHFHEWIDGPKRKNSFLRRFARRQ